MKRQTNILFNRLSMEEMEKLTTAVKEVTADGCQQTGSKIFTVADLWNIQKQRRGFVQRRFSH